MQIVSLTEKRSNDPSDKQIFRWRDYKHKNKEPSRGKIKTLSQVGIDRGTQNMAGIHGFDHVYDIDIGIHLA